jgi:glutaredoxin
VTLYTKPDCSLCEDALRVLEHVRARRSFELEQVDITANADLRALYGERVPVVAVDGDTAFELHVDEQRLEELLARRGAGAEDAAAASP